MSLVQSMFTPHRLALAGTARAPLSQMVQPNREPGLAAMLTNIRKYLNSDGKRHFL